MSDKPPCPYAALGVSKDADQAAIKKAYRKLVLTCHPDKVADEFLKKQKQEEFHKIQTAYELIGDDETRAKYDAEQKLEQLRKEAAAARAAGGPRVEVKTARYETRTAAPGGATFTSTGPSRYEERRPTYEERKPSDRAYFEERAHRKYDAYESVPRTRTVRPEKESVRSKTSADRTRSDRVKSRDKDERRERSSKFQVYTSEDYYSSSGDDKKRYEAEYKRRSDDERRRKDEDEARKEAAAARKRAEERRSYEEVKGARHEPRRHRSNEEPLDRERKMYDLADGAVRYMYASKAEAADLRPSASRSSSARDAHYDHYDARSSRRPETVRRSSARPRDHSSPSRKGPQIVDWEEDRRAPPAFRHSNSSPADIRLPPRATPVRSQTEYEKPRTRVDTSPANMFRRADTMPAVPTPSSYTKDSTPRHSPLRTAEYTSASPREHRDAEPVYATIPPAKPASTTRYYYPGSGGGVTLVPDHDVANGYRTTIREPGSSHSRTHSHRHRSRSPLARPPIGPNRPSEPMRTASHTSPSTAIPPPPLGRTATFTASPDDRGRSGSRTLFGEVKRDPRMQTSFSPERVVYSRKPGPEDIRWSVPSSSRSGRTDEREREREREYVNVKPAFSRTATTAY